MSIRERKVQVPASERTETDTVCDICGAVQPHDESGWPAEPDWGRSAYHDVTIKSTRHEVGYEGDGAETGVEWDICQDCFATKVAPFLETLAKPRKVDESW